MPRQYTQTHAGHAIWSALWLNEFCSLAVTQFTHSLAVTRSQTAAFNSVNMWCLRSIAPVGPFIHIDVYWVSVYRNSFPLHFTRACIQFVVLLNFWTHFVMIVIIHYATVCNLASAQYNPLDINGMRDEMCERERKGEANEHDNECQSVSEQDRAREST